MPDKIEIIIAEDHPTFSLGIEQALAAYHDMDVIGKVSNGKQLMQALNIKLPGLILMDIMMPYMTGIEAATLIKRDHPSVKIIFLTMYDDEHIINQCVAIGDGYISKTATTDELIKAIYKVAKENGRYFEKVKQPELKPSLYSDDLVKKYKLTRREIELISLLRTGKTTKEIAGKLFLSVFTIETHRKNIFRKLEVKNIAELISFAINNNIV